MPLDRKILEDRERYPDNLEIQMGDTKVALGDLREFYAARDTEVRQSLTRAQELENANQRLTELYNGLSTEVEGLRTRSAQPDQSSLVDQLVARLKGESDSILTKPGEFFSPVVEKLKEIENLKKAITDQQEQTAKSLRDAFAWQLQKDMRRDYRSLKWPDDMSFEKAVQYATANGYVDDAKYPDFYRAHDALTAPQRRQQELTEAQEKARAEGYEKGRREAIERTHVPQPGFGGGAPPKSKVGGIDKLNDMDILSDPDIQATFLNGGGTGQ